MVSDLVYCFVVIAIVYVDQTDNKTDSDLGQLPMNAAEQRNDARVSRCSRDQTKCSDVTNMCSDVDDFVAGLVDDDSAVVATVVVADSARGYLNLALLLRMAFATGRYPLWLLSYSSCSSSARTSLHA